MNTKLTPQKSTTINSLYRKATYTSRQNTSARFKGIEKKLIYQNTEPFIDAE